MASAILGRLKARLGGGRRFRRPDVARERPRWARERPPWLRLLVQKLPLVLAVVAFGVALAVAGWLFLSSDDTLARRAAMVPYLVVDVTAPGDATGPGRPIAKPGEDGAAKPVATPAEATPAKPDGETSGKPSAPPHDAPHEAPHEAPQDAPKDQTAAPPGPPPPQMRADGTVVLTPAPVPEITEDTPDGPLPRISSDGRQPWRTYARPFPGPDQGPRLAIVISDLGLSGAVTSNALAKLPGVVTLAFLPYADRLDSWVDAARRQGHEILLALPMESTERTYDPGPRTLRVGLPAASNIERLEWALSRVAGYVGVTSLSGSRFMTETSSVQPVIDVLKKRGLMLFDSRVAGNSVGAAIAAERKLPWAMANLIIDADPSRGTIDAQLRKLEDIALAEGAAIGIGQPYPSTIERVAQWLPTVTDRKLVMAPVSAIVGRQKLP
ncbi:MAG: divergent polysaccharide deacetylase family protein [Azospirillum sp.]|nr:divergent polysaccharide deacetylase family protein [Azospirillum sp.]